LSTVTLMVQKSFASLAERDAEIKRLEELGYSVNVEDDGDGTFSDEEDDDNLGDHPEEA
jgi:hypothetical protein